MGPTHHMRKAVLIFAAVAVSSVVSSQDAPASVAPESSNSYPDTVPEDVFEDSDNTMWERNRKEEEKTKQNIASLKDRSFWKKHCPGATQDMIEDLVRADVLAYESKCTMRYQTLNVFHYRGRHSQSKTKIAARNKAEIKRVFTRYCLPKTFKSRRFCSQRCHYVHRYGEEVLEEIDVKSPKVPDDVRRLQNDISGLQGDEDCKRIMLEELSSCETSCKEEESCYLPCFRSIHNQVLSKDKCYSMHQKIYGEGIRIGQSQAVQVPGRRLLGTSYSSPPPPSPPYEPKKKCYDVCHQNCASETGTLHKGNYRFGNENAKIYTLNRKARICTLPARYRITDTSEQCVRSVFKALPCVDGNGNPFTCNPDVSPRWHQLDNEYKGATGSAECVRRTM